MKAITNINENNLHSSIQFIISHITKYDNNTHLFIELLESEYNIKFDKCEKKDIDKFKQYIQMFIDFFK